MRLEEARNGKRRGGTRLALALPLLLALAPAAASAPETAAAPDPATVGSISRAQSIEAERRRVADQLAALGGQIHLSQESVEKLDAEIAAIAADRERVRTAMIEAAAAQKSIAREITATEKRIDALAGDEGRLKGSLRERRGLLAEVLGALERMGRKPPPALLVKPDDALGSVRSAILLGAVVPGIRKETETLARDLAQLAAVKAEIGREKTGYVDSLTRQREEEARLSRLFGEKERLEAANRDRRKAEADRAAELAAQATSLEDLVARLQKEANLARTAEEAARREAERNAREAEERRLAEAKRLAEEERQAALDAARTAPQGPDDRLPATPPAEPPTVAATPAEPTYDIASLRRDMARLEPAAPFSTLRGRLTVPVSGDVRVRYGDSDGIGRPAAGVTFAARAGEAVTAPADGQVLYSGPFRSYGQLLILDAGDGYHVVLAGMTAIDVDVGQFVLSGEPVAVMGAKRVASAAGADFDAAEPSLYVEFRKDGKPVDPQPWWADRPSGRTKNDS